MDTMSWFVRTVNGRAGYFVAGALSSLGIVLAVSWLSPSASFHNLYENGEQYSFINPLLSCADSEFTPLETGKSRELHEKVGARVQELKNRGSLVDAGIYFRELHDGPWFGINETQEFTPGSLLKVPLAMSVYNAAEDDPGLLAKPVAYSGAPSPEEHFKAPVIEVGKSYTVSELVRAMLENSDNNAAYLLAELIGMDRLDESYSRLGIEAPTSGKDYSTSVRSYASFFRVLYTATYLDRKASEELLSVLSKSAFTQGIVAGVPNGVVVSHKFGERALVGSTSAQLHDCGIVYVPERPYLLCIMMRGTDFDTLAKSIAEVSSLVYSYAK